MKISWFAAACAIVASLSAGVASAQPSPPPVPGGGGYTRPPAFSPYLNLLRRGNSPALNYYGLVRPELEFRSSIGNIANSVSQNQQAIGNLAASGTLVGPTGHPTQFMNLGGYFMSNSSTGMQSVAPRVGGTGGAPPPRRR